VTPRDGEAFLALTDQIAKARGVCVGSYKHGCLVRRIAARMRARSAENYLAYARVLRDDPMVAVAKTCAENGPWNVVAIAEPLGGSRSLPPASPPVSPPPLPSLPVDPWLTAPHTAPQRVADTRRQPMRLSALFEEFCHFLRVEKGATPATIATYRWCFGDFQAFVMKQVGGTVLLAHFTEETCRRYQYDLAGRELKSGTIRVRLAVLGSFGKWMVRRDKLVRNPADRLTRPRRKARVPAVPAWDTVKVLLEQCGPRERAILARVREAQG